MNKSDLIGSRDMLPGDYNFIMATWLRGLYYGDSQFSIMKKDTFMKRYQTYLDALLKAPEIKVKISCLKEDPSIILGYAVLSGNDDVLHWVFVKKPWRKIGIAKSLVTDKVTKVTHLTKLGQSLLDKCKFEYDPFAL